MPRKIKRSDIEQVWHVYGQIHGMPTPTQEEIQRGLPKLIRAATGETWKGPIITGTTGPTRFQHVDRDGTRGYELWVNRKSGWPAICEDLAKAVAVPEHAPAIEIKLARRVCEQHWLVGKLQPPPKVKPTKDQVKAAKIERLQQRKAAWERKQLRARKAIQKINRSLTAYRRHES